MATDFTLAFMQRVDAKLDRIQTTLDDHTQQLLRIRGRLVSHDSDALRQEETIAKLDQRVARIERRLELVE